LQRFEIASLTLATTADHLAGGGDLLALMQAAFYNYPNRFICESYAPARDQIARPVVLVRGSP